jgi:hypothetical protein
MNAEPKSVAAQPSAEAARQWDDELADAIETPPPSWHEPGYNAFRFARSGLLLGAIAGCTSLIVNVIGSVLWPAISGQEQHPLRLIQVYLTFPFGQSALQLDSGLLLASGCILYLVTGMVYGVLFVLAISYFVPHAGLLARLVACCILALLVWTVNFYFVLTWLQPVVFGGAWIAQLVPWWVAAITHLVFGATISAIYPAAPPAERNPRLR